MTARTPFALLSAAFLAQAAHGQTFYFDGTSGWLVRSTTAPADLSFPDTGSNSNQMEYTFADGRLEGYQWGGSAYAAKNGRVQFSVASNGQDNAPFNRVATAFSWAMDAWSADYGWAAIPSNRSGAMTGHNPPNAPNVFASKIGDQFQMEVYASNYLTRFGWAQATAKIRDAPLLANANSLTTTMTNLLLLDQDPLRAGVQVLPGNIPVHVTAGASIVSRSLIDFGSFGSVASPFKDSFYRDTNFTLTDLGTNMIAYGVGRGSPDVVWDPSDPTAQKTLGAFSDDHLLQFTNADIGKIFSLHYTVSLRGGAYGADGEWLGAYTIVGPASDSYTIEVIPAPGTLTAAAAGLLALRRRRRP
jgi:uncharacterized protein (TIGR03382 family)